MKHGISMICGTDIHSSTTKKRAVNGLVLRNHGALRRKNGPKKMKRTCSNFLVPLKRLKKLRPLLSQTYIRWAEEIRVDFARMQGDKTGLGGGF